MSEPKDCRKIDGDVAVIISRDTAIAALTAMQAYYTRERTAHMFADDASFLRANFAELERAAESGRE